MPLILAGLATAVMVVTLAALLTLGATEPIIAKNHLRGTQAFFLAESGLEITLARLNAGEPVTTFSGTLGAGTYIVTATPFGVGRVHVMSLGQVEMARRVVSNVFQLDENGRWEPMAQFQEEPS